MNAQIIRMQARKPNITLLTIMSDSGTRQYELSEGTYREIGCPLSGDIIDEESLMIIANEDARRRALRSALSALSYSDKSRSALKQKLREKKYPEWAIEYAIEECLSHGYIDEERTLIRLCGQYANRELLGPEKIKAKLAARGYPLGKISAVLTSLTADGTIDFSLNLSKLLKAKCNENNPREKIMHKYGYYHD